MSRCPVVRLPMWLLVAAMVVLVVLASLSGWRYGELLERMDRRAEAREAEMVQLHEDMERLKADIREEIRTPAGERAVTHDAARAAVEGMRELDRKIDLLLEAHGLDGG